MAEADGCFSHEAVIGPAYLLARSSRRVLCTGGANGGGAQQDPCCRILFGDPRALLEPLGEPFDFAAPYAITVPSSGTPWGFVTAGDDDAHPLAAGLPRHTAGGHRA